MNLTLLLNFLRCQSAAKANHLSGWVGIAVAGAAGFLVSGGYVQQIQDFVCKANQDDLGLAVAAIGAVASLVNSGATKALSPAQESVAAPLDNVSTVQPVNSDLARVSQPYPVAKR